MTEDSGSDQGASNGGNEVYLDSGYILKVEPTEFADVIIEQSIVPHIIIWEWKTIY